MAQSTRMRIVNTKNDCIEPAGSQILSGGVILLTAASHPAEIMDFSASPDIIYDTVKKGLRRFGTQKYVANLGHSCFPDMKPSVCG